MNCKNCKKKDTCEFLPIIKSAGITEHNCNHFEENKEYKAFNVNNHVRFKLSTKGEEDIHEYWTQYYGKHLFADSLLGEADEEGYRTCRLWTLMRYIAPFIDLGKEPPFETTIYFESKDLHEETK